MLITNCLCLFGFYFWCREEDCEAWDFYRRENESFCKIETQPWVIWLGAKAWWAEKRTFFHSWRNTSTLCLVYSTNQLTMFSKTKLTGRGKSHSCTLNFVVMIFVLIYCIWTKKDVWEIVKSSNFKVCITGQSAAWTLHRPHTIYHTGKI